MSLRNKKLGRRNSPEARILINSLMDMFIIILVFLLFNFSAEQVEFGVAENVDLPASTSDLKFENAINVVITPYDIQVDGKKIASIRHGKIRGARVRGKRILPLHRELRRQKAIAEYKAKKQGFKKPKEEETLVLLQADKSTPYHIIDKVLKSSGMAGYPKFRFAVVRRES